MSVGVQEQAGVAPRAPGGRATAGRMSAYDLAFLAAGGVIGSGWMLSTTQIDAAVPGWWALGSWLIGGLLTLVVAVVMVELSVRAPKTGGLIFLPLQTGGPLLATVVAAGVWAYYAVNPASEAAAIVQNLANLTNWHWLAGFRVVQVLFAMLCLALVTTVNLLGPRGFLAVNKWLTGIKVVVPVLVVIVLLLALCFLPAHGAHFPAAQPAPPPKLAPPPRLAPSGTSDWSAMLGAVVGSGVLYSYLGFQGPIDFAGNVKGGDGREAARLRRAVYGTVIGSIVLYTALQCVVIYLRSGHSTGDVDKLLPGESSVYTVFVGAVVRPGWLAWIVKAFLNLDSVLSPAGTALVFTYVMTREVAALSRAHLTHRGLQRSENSVFRPKGVLRIVLRLAGDDRLDVYKRILAVDLVVCLVALVLTWGNWSVLQSISSVLALLVYATPGVTLAALCRYDRSGLYPRVFAWVSAFGFAALAVVFVLSTKGVPRGMLALVAGCALLLWIPVVFPGARWYDARAHWREFDPANSRPARLAAVLGGYFAALALAETIRCYLWPSGIAWGWDLLGLCGVVAFSFFAFDWMVRLSADFMAEDSMNPPLLPKPFPGLLREPAPSAIDQGAPRPATETGS